MNFFENMYKIKIQSLNIDTYTDMNFCAKKTELLDKQKQEELSTDQYIITY